MKYSLRKKPLKKSFTASSPRSIVRSAPVAVLLSTWMLTMIVPVLLLLSVRDRWLESLARPEVQENWESFREDMRKQSGLDGPVQRKVRKSDEPPARVWLRDYFWLAIAAWLVLGTTLFACFGVLFVGVSGTYRWQHVEPGTLKKTT